jgi:hypothetical protein
MKTTMLAQISPSIYRLLATSRFGIFFRQPTGLKFFRSKIVSGFDMIVEHAASWNTDYCNDVTYAQR